MGTASHDASRIETFQDKKKSKLSNHHQCGREALRFDFAKDVICLGCRTKESFEVSKIVSMRDTPLSVQVSDHAMLIAN